MNKWQYRKEMYCTEQTLAKLGLSGWELCGVNKVFYIFKRLLNCERCSHCKISHQKSLHDFDTVFECLKDGIPKRLYDNRGCDDFTEE